MGTPFNDRSFQTQGNHDAETLTYSALRSFHMDGNYAMLAIAFLSLEGALTWLAERGGAHRHQIQVHCAHPGTGVRDAIEYVTRAVTRGQFHLDKTLPLPRINPHADFAYAWELGDSAHRVRCQVLPGVLPNRFYELFGMARRGEITDATHTELEQLKLDIEARVLLAAPQDVVSFEQVST